MNDPAAPLRIIVADDQASVREGLVLLLGGLPGIEVVASAPNGARAIELVAEHQPGRSELRADYRHVERKHVDDDLHLITGIVDPSKPRHRRGQEW